MTEARGHPSLLQAYGQATWDAADGATLTYDDAWVGVVSGQAHLDTGFYRPQWERATLRNALNSKRWPWTPAARPSLVTSPPGWERH